MLEFVAVPVIEASSAACVDSGRHFDLTTVLASFGASVPLFLWLLKMHRDLVTIVIPRGFRLIRREMKRQGKESKERHAEHVKIVRLLTRNERRRIEAAKMQMMYDTDTDNTSTPARRSKPRRRRR